MFALEPCIAFDRKNKAKKWFEPLLFDQAYLHAMSFSVLAYFDLVGGRRPDPSIQGVSEHYCKAVQLLRQRISEENGESKLSDQTVAVILTFAGHSFMMGEYEAAKQHLEGLFRVISLRGGTSTFKHNPKQLITIYRYVVPIWCWILLSLGLTHHEIVATYRLRYTVAQIPYSSIKSAHQESLRHIPI